MSRAALLFSLVCLALGGCSSSAPPPPDADVDASMACNHAAGIDDGGAGACFVGRLLLSCDLPSGGGSVCVTDSTCEGYAGAACTNSCAVNEYAVACGGPPAFDASVAYAQPPAGCRGVFGSPGGNGYYCCPCQ